MEQKKKVQVHAYINAEIAELFQKTYPECRVRFIENSMSLALNDKDFFDRIFFKDIYPKGAL